jgi:hypothetical protein
VQSVRHTFFPALLLSPFISLLTVFLVCLLLLGLLLCLTLPEFLLDQFPHLLELSQVEQVIVGCVHLSVLALRGQHLL